MLNKTELSTGAMVHFQIPDQLLMRTPSCGMESSLWLQIELKPLGQRGPLGSAPWNSFHLSELLDASEASETSQREILN